MAPRPAFIVALCLAGSWLVPPSSVRAQDAGDGRPPAEESPEPTSQDPVEPVPAEPSEAPVLDVTEIASKERATRAAVQGITEQLEDDAEIESVRAEIEESMAALPGAIARDRGILATVGSVATVAELEASWSDVAEDLDAAIQVLDRRGSLLKESLERLDEMADTWERTLAALDEDAPPAAIEEVQAVLVGIAAARDAALSRREALVSLQTRVADTVHAVEEIVDDIDATMTRLQRSLLSVDAPPLWTALARDGIDLSSQPIRDDWSRRIEGLRGYLSEVRSVLLLQAAAVVAVLAMFVGTRRQSAGLAGETDESDTLAPLRRPVSAALLVGLLPGALLHSSPPMGWRMAVVPVAVVSSLRVLMVVLPERSRRGFLWLCALYVADNARGLVAGLPALERLVFVTEAVLAVIVYYGLQRAAVAASRPRWSVIGLRAATFLAAAGTACLVLGLVGLGRLITGATITVTFSAFAFVALSRVLHAMVVMALRTRLLGRLHMVARSRDVVQRHLTRWTSVLVFLLFADTALRRFTVRNPLLEALGDVLSAPLQVGSLSLSLGDVMVFGAVVWASFQLSKAIRFVFEQDVFSRMELPRGVPYAASNAMHYAVLLLGFFVAIMAAGVDVGRFAIIGGALGVGVGFGLQNVVNNFVSGLILLFERPVQIGDRVEVGEVLGTVERIGIRSSTLRTYDGAEVIVPNSNLISDRVTNWTLSDRQRRIIVPIGVAYGTDPDGVLELLLEAARGHPDVLEKPEPQAFFTAHGESSLDFELRAWTDKSNDWVRIRSELTLALNRALVAADIEIPFPQRDLHLRSSDVSLGADRPAEEIGSP